MESGDPYRHGPIGALAIGPGQAPRGRADAPPNLIVWN